MTHGPTLSRSFLLRTDALLPIYTYNQQLSNIDKLIIRNEPMNPVVLDKILRYLGGNRSSNKEKKVGYVDNIFRKKQEYIPGFPPSKIKQIQMFPDNEKLDREKCFVLNGDASNLRPIANIHDSNGNMI
ncbi:MAG TPA: hypothetical protein VNB95_03525, partial [Nitrososphaera sp.]|nr:hypothetical protein [Nitrososphaera sp.]